MRRNIYGQARVNICGALSMFANSRRLNTRDLKPEQNLSRGEMFEHMDKVESVKGR